MSPSFSRETRNLRGLHCIIEPLEIIIDECILDDTISELQYTLSMQTENAAKIETATHRQTSGLAFISPSALSRSRSSNICMCVRTVLV